MLPLRGTPRPQRRVGRHPPLVSLWPSAGHHARRTAMGDDGRGYHSASGAARAAPLTSGPDLASVGAVEQRGAAGCRSGGPRQRGSLRSRGDRAGGLGGPGGDARSTGAPPRWSPAGPVQPCRDSLNTPLSAAVNAITPAPLWCHRRVTSGCQAAGLDAGGVAGRLAGGVEGGGRGGRSRRAGAWPGEAASARGTPLDSAGGVGCYPAGRRRPGGFRDKWPCP